MAYAPQAENDCVHCGEHTTETSVPQPKNHRGNIENNGTGVGCADIDKRSALLYDPDIEKKGRYCELMRIRN